MEFRMVQAIISNFLKNSDFTTQKQRGAYEMTVNVPAGNYSYGQTFTQTVNVPAGAYFENVTIDYSLRPNEYYPTNHCTLPGTNDDWFVYAGVFQQSAGVYALQVTLMALAPGTTPIPAFSTHTKLHLSKSPFE